MGTLQHIEHQVSAINDLIKLNNDRVAGYQKAIDETDDAALKELFLKYSGQSQQNANELTEHVHQLGGSPSDGTTIAGKFHHVWMDVKATFTGKDRHSILSDCESGEDAAKLAYRKALDDKELIWEDDNLVAILTKQFDEIKEAHNYVKALRDGVAVQ